MTALADRRSFLKFAVGGAAGLALSRAAPSGARAGEGPVVGDEIGERLHLLQGAGGNVVARVDTTGALMVDGGLAEHADALLHAVSTRAGGGCVHTLFNTHWHAGHTGSNLAAGRAGATIIAHENTRLWLTRPVHVEWQDRIYAPLPAVALPNETTYDSGTLTMDDERIDYGYMLQAHTDGDIYVFLREANVLVTGGTLTVGRYPVSDPSTGGWIGGMLDATRRLLELADEDTRLVPAKGPLQGRQALVAQHEMLETVFSRMVEMIQQGLSAGEMIEEGVTRGFDEQWGDPNVFVANAYRGMWGHIREFEAGIV